MVSINYIPHSIIIKYILIVKVLLLCCIVRNHNHQYYYCTSAFTLTTTSSNKRPYHNKNQQQQQQQQKQQYYAVSTNPNMDSFKMRSNGISFALLSSSSDSIRTTTTTTTTTSSTKSLAEYKMEIVQLGAMLDRGQAYNPTSGEYYKERMDITKDIITSFLQNYSMNNIPKSINDIQGEWELVLSTVSHGIFRSSPFFLAIQESYELYAENKQSFGMNKAELFFKLHELQTCSWGISKIGRVAQYIKTTPPTTSTTTENNNNDVGNYLYSEFDTSIFSLTVIPILGWFKLLPTFGGCVITAAKIDTYDSNTGKLSMIVDYTTARPVSGLSGLGDWIWSVKVPVGWIWKNLLPWNKGRDATCSVFIRYVDSNFRIVQDVSGDYFVYTRPIIPRPLDLYT
jgi:hypothetical protein